MDFEFHMKSFPLRAILLCFMIFPYYASAQTVARVENYIKREAPSSQQGAALYGKYLFLFSDKGICNIYDLENKAHLGQMEYERTDLKHSDTACFGAYRIDEKDEFPVVYISGSQVNKRGEKGMIWVYRIMHDNKKWNMKLYQIIYTPIIDEVGSFPDALLSNSDGCMWIMGWKTSLAKTPKDGSGAYLNFAKFRTPALEEGTLDRNGIRIVTLSKSDVITSFTVNNAHAIQQGICLKNQNIYVPYGYSAGGYQGIDIISLEEGRVVGNINLMGTGVGEPEAVFFYKGGMYIADQATSIKRILNYKEYE